MSSGVVVIGGANLDIGGKTFFPLIDGDSNPGTVRTSLVAWGIISPEICGCSERKPLF